MSVVVKIEDRVTITCPVPANAEESAQFSTVLDARVRSGYVIVGAQDIEHGQRDPYVVGIKVTLERKDV